MSPRTSARPRRRPQWYCGRAPDHRQCRSSPDRRCGTALRDRARPPDPGEDLSADELFVARHRGKHRRSVLAWCCSVRLNSPTVPSAAGGEGGRVDALVGWMPWSGGGIGTGGREWHSDAAWFAPPPPSHTREVEVADGLNEGDENEVPHPNGHSFCVHV